VVLAKREMRSGREAPTRPPTAVTLPRFAWEG
jgi:hypothetical protein